MFASRPMDKLSIPTTRCPFASSVARRLTQEAGHAGDQYVGRHTVWKNFSLLSI